jgi:hypothetical protein
MREDWKHIRDEYQPSKRSEWIGAVIAAGFAGGIGLMLGMALCGIGL